MMVWFETILVALTALTGLIWLLDKLFFAKRRLAAAGVLEEAREPVVVDYAKAFFPILALVLGLRSFVGEPFRIPSSSMMPTLLIGDFILVNKFAYGLRWPITNKKFLDNGEPERGDVVVFRPPHHPREDWIKRVVGLPGDKVEYFDKKLTINGQPVPQNAAGDYLHTDRLYYSPTFIEKLGNVEHRIIVENAAPAYVSQVTKYPFQENCTYTNRGLSCTVPAGHYFMMGDNRDGSFDSRGWGFVPEQNIVGKAFFIWFNFSDLKRIGSFQ